MDGRVAPSISILQELPYSWSYFVRNHYKVNTEDDTCKYLIGSLADGLRGRSLLPFSAWFCSPCSHMPSRLAQAAPTRFESTTLGTPAHDVAMAGTVQQVVTTRTLGTQLVAEGPQGSFTANLGSALSDQMRQSLSPGTPVQVSGVMETTNGKSYLLARKLTVAGAQVTIRNQHGFLVHNSASRGAK